MRPTKARTICCMPACRRFRPCQEQGESDVIQADGDGEEIIIGLDMLEAMRLVDAEGMNQDDAARSMDVSTPTLCRILGQGRRLAAEALTAGKIIRIEGGNVMYGYSMQGRHGQRFCHGRRGEQGQGGGACCGTEGMEFGGRGMGHRQGRGRCGAARGMCRRGNFLSGECEASAQKADSTDAERAEQ
ncbi:MAG: DUF134 domain-containing protein [Desulfovibrio sp.]|nr:DUF134 domain-containing protein [Desulfovibrio sp.]